MNSFLRMSKKTLFGKFNMGSKIVAIIKTKPRVTKRVLQKLSYIFCYRQIIAIKEVKMGYSSFNG